jgi:guanyl-specific ribonuclease Sa
LKQIEKRGGSSPVGYKGNRIYANDGRSNSPILPKQINDQPISYTEYDVNPPQKINDIEIRGVERVVKGSDGSIYYSPDHYKTFIKIN